MGNYTPEQVEQRVNAIQDAVSAGRMTAPMVFTKMREIIAATLRQQAGRVDEGMARRLCTKFDELGYGYPDTDDAKLALTAALAQNTQGDAVAWLCDAPDDGTRTAVIAKALADMVERNGWTVQPLYLHAERARASDVDAMVSRFLGWTLPKDFAPDAGISFKPIPNPHGDPYPWPTGTNLLHAGQAKAMFEYVLAAAPSQRAEVK